MNALRLLKEMFFLLFIFFNQKSEQLNLVIILAFDLDYLKIVVYKSKCSSFIQQIIKYYLQGSDLNSFFDEFLIIGHNVNRRHDFDMAIKTSF